VRLYGTHFDSDVAKNPSVGGAHCIGVKMLRGGIVDGRFESSQAVGVPHGNGVVIQGGADTHFTSSIGITLTRSGGVVTVAGAGGHGYLAGEIVSISMCD